MAALWEEYSWTFGLTTVNSQASAEIFHNEVDDHIFASAPITIVDGIVTIAADVHALTAIKLGVFPELYNSADVEATLPHTSEWWYRWHATKGTLVFRLRSKRTIYPEQKLWWMAQKKQDVSLQDVYVGANFLMVRHQ